MRFAIHDTNVTIHDSTNIMRKILSTRTHRTGYRLTLQAFDNEQQLPSHWKKGARVVIFGRRFVVLSCTGFKITIGGDLDQRELDLINGFDKINISTV